MRHLVVLRTGHLIALFMCELPPGARARPPRVRINNVIMLHPLIYYLHDKGQRLFQLNSSLFGLLALFKEEVAEWAH